jgi:hypothetical protein
MSHAVWLYHVFSLSLRMVEEMLAARCIVVSYEIIRRWALKFGQDIANRIRRRLSRAGDKRHLDEVAIKIAGVQHWLWHGRPGRAGARRAGAAPARQVGTVLGDAVECHVDEPGILRRRDPFAFLAAALDQVEEAAPVTVGIAADLSGRWLTFSTISAQPVGCNATSWGVRSCPSVLTRA